MGNPSDLEGATFVAGQSFHAPFSAASRCLIPWMPEMRHGLREIRGESSAHGLGGLSDVGLGGVGTSGREFLPA